MEFEFLGLTFSEPITALTNLGIALICLYAYLQASKVSSYPGHRSWLYFFASLGLTTFMGFFSHLFSSYDIHWFRVSGWIFGGLAAYFSQVASIEQVTKKNTGILMWLSKFEFVSFLIALFWFQKFEVVLVITVIALLIVLAIHTYGYFSKILLGSELILIGFIISALTAVARLLKVSFHPVYFNYHDVAHLMMMVAALIILMGVRRASPVE